MTLIEANKRLWLKQKSGTRDLWDALSSAKKVEIDLEDLKKENAIVEKFANGQVPSSRLRLGNSRFRLASWRLKLIN